MNITSKFIRTFNPCQDSIENFEREYPEFNGSIIEFFKLDKIAYNDKVWVGVRLLNKNQLVQWSIMCAESVLYIIKSRRPGDLQPIRCIEVLKSISDFENISAIDLQRIRDARGDAYATDTNIYIDEAAHAIYAAADEAASAGTAYGTAASSAAAYAAIAAANNATTDSYTTAANIRESAREEQMNLNLMYLASLLAV